MTPPRIDHIGIIVPDLDAAIARFSALLGGLAPVDRNLPEVGLRIAEFHTANLNIELINYDGPAELARRVMGDESSYRRGGECRGGARTSCVIGLCRTGRLSPARRARDRGVF